MHVSLLADHSHSAKLVAATTVCFLVVCLTPVCFAELYVLRNNSSES